MCPCTLAETSTVSRLAQTLARVYGAEYAFHTALERTYLAWLRSSTALAHFGVVVTQLFRLSKTQSPHIARLGKPLGLVSISLAILVISVGGLRSWQQQRLILNGKVRSGGWDICMLILLLLGVSRTLFFSDFQQALI